MVIGFVPGNMVFVEQCVCVVVKILNLCCFLFLGFVFLLFSSHEFGELMLSYCGDPMSGVMYCVPLVVNFKLIKPLQGRHFHPMCIKYYQNLILTVCRPSSNLFRY